MRTCKHCGCTDNNCNQCVERTGAPCWWVCEDVCSACDAAGGKKAKHAPITPEQSIKIVDMRVDKKMSCQNIANRLGLSKGAVSWHLLKLGIEKGGEPPKNYKPQSPEHYTFMRNGHQVRGFTPEEDRRLLELEAQGMKVHKIAEAIGRKNNSVRGRLHTLARRDERLEAKALTAERVAGNGRVAEVFNPSVVAEQRRV